MSETKLDKSVSSSEFLPERFQGHVIRKDRTIHGGGVLIAHRKGLVANPVACKGIKSDCELVMSRVQMSQGQPPLYVGAYYRSQVDNSPNTSLDGLDSALEQVYDLVGNSKSTVVLAGDFNCPDIDWDNLSTRAGCKLVSVSDKLIRISSKFGLSQLQKDPTRLTSLLDLFFTNNDSLLSAIETVPGIATADEHVAIVTDLNLKAEICKSVPHRVHQWKNVDWEKSEVRRRLLRISFVLIHMVNLSMTNGSLLNNIWTIFWRFMSLLNYQNLGKTSHGSTGSWNADAGGSRDYITAGKTEISK